MKTLFILCALLLGVTQMKADTPANKITEELNVEYIRERISIVGDIYVDEPFILFIPQNGITDWSTTLTHLGYDYERHGYKFSLNTPDWYRPNGEKVLYELLIGTVEYTAGSNEKTIVYVYANLHFK